VTGHGSAPEARAVGRSIILLEGRADAVTADTIAVA
jgi:hypothetical protein